MSKVPFAASACVAIKPMPVPPPVTRQTWPLTENSVSALSSCVLDIPTERLSGKGVREGIELQMGILM